ncbi:MAG: insulinase family protein [Hyphomicrobiales bacterium]|nr:insulinase family protein [Hyphomicrobiales bacterium]
MGLKAYQGRRYGISGKRHLLTVCCICIALLILLPSHLLALTSPEIKVHSFTLPNGMKVYVIPHGTMPVLTHMVWYKVGAQDEPPGESGIAHFLEHLMFKGTKNTGPGQFSEIVASLGGDENAMTSQDYTVYYQTIAIQHLPRVMALEADRMLNLSFGQKDFDHEKQVILEERSSRMESTARAKLLEHMRNALYINHPYGKPVIGWRHEIASLTESSVRHFYESYYAPNNASLVLAGGITPEEGLRLARRFYGHLPPARSITKHQTLSEPPHNVARSLTLQDKTVSRPEWTRMYLAPSASHGDTEHAMPLVVLAQVLGGSETGRLTKALVLNQKLAISAGADYDLFSFGPSIFSIHVYPIDSDTMERIEDQVEEQIRQIILDGITQEELERAKAVLRADYIYAQDSARTLGFVVGQAIFSGLSPEYLSSYLQKLDAVTLEQVQQAAALVLKEKQSVTGILKQEKSNISPSAEHTRLNPVLIGPPYQYGGTL